MRSLGLKVFLSVAAITTGLAEASAATVLTSSYSQAVANGPFNAANTGSQINIPFAHAQSPDSTIYYDPAIGYNAVEGSVSQVGGAESLANLLVGQLRAAAGTTTHVTGYLIFGWNAAAAYGDTLFFKHIGASPTTKTTVNFSVNLTGTLGDLPGGNGTGSGQPLVQFGLSFGAAGGTNYVPQSFSQSAFNMVSPVNVGQTWYGDLGPFNHILTGSFEFTGAAAIIPMTEFLAVSGQYGYADLYDTAQFSFGTLPDGVSFNSASGEFLAGAVPEPSTWAMIVLGFCGIGYMAYRRKDGAIRCASS